MGDVRVVIVEDEPPARAKLKRMLAEHAGYRVVAEAGDVVGGLAALRSEKPDLLFLDIRLGGGSGFDVLARSVPPYPLIVFTTAHHEHALRAFEYAALDYLLKPFDRERFARTLQRVGERLAEADTDAGEERLRKLGRALDATPRLCRIIVHERGRSLVVPIGEVSRLAQRLDPAEFLRVHRSHLVRADAIRAIAPWAHGDLKLTLNDGSELMLSRRYKRLLPENWQEA